MTNDDAQRAKVFLLSDSTNDSYVAIGEVMTSDYTAERLRNAGRGGGNRIRVVLKTVTKPDTVLPFSIEDGEGRVLCRTLEEAYKKNEGVMWLQSDTVLTQRDGCTIITMA